MSSGRENKVIKFPKIKLGRKIKNEKKQKEAPENMFRMRKMLES